MECQQGFEPCSSCLMVQDLVDDFEEFLWKSLARKRAKQRAMSRNTSIEDEKSGDGLNRNVKFSG